MVPAGLHKQEEDESKLQTRKAKLAAVQGNSPIVGYFDSAEFLSNLHNARYMGVSQKIRRAKGTDK